MSVRISIFRESDFVKSATLLVVTTIGAVLPLDFIRQIDGYLMYLRPWEIIPVFGWTVLFYLLFSLIGSTAILGATVCLGALLRQSPSTTLRFAGPWLSMSFVLHELIRTAILWLTGLDSPELSALIEKSHWMLNLLILVVCAGLVVSRPKLFYRLYALLRVVAVMAVIIACIALFAESVYSVRFRRRNKPTVQQDINSTRPNIVLITVDALAANHLNLYGYSRLTTPNLNQLAQHSTVFERFYANGNFTSPSINSILHGVRPWSHRVIQLWARPEAELAEQGLIPSLHKAGYQTLVVTTNPAATLFQSRLAAGLDHITTPKINVTNAKLWGSLTAFSYYAYVTDDSARIGYLLFCIDRALVRLGIWENAGQFDPELAVSAAGRFVLGRDAEKPMFLWIHLMPPHSPYATPAPFAGHFDVSAHHRSRFDSTPLEKYEAKYDGEFPQQYIGRYDEAVYYTDNSIGHILNFLNSKNLFDSTLLIVTADHGESFSHGYSTHGGPMMLDDIIHVPLIVKEPGQAIAQRRSDLAEQIDLMPTILNLAGVPGTPNPEGRSLVPALHGGQKMEGQIFSMNFEQNSRFKQLTTGSIAMVWERWKFVHYMGTAHYAMMPKIVDSLYDLQTDPGENANLIAQEPAIAAKMLAAIEEQLRIHGKSLP